MRFGPFESRGMDCTHVCRLRWPRQYLESAPGCWCSHRHPV